jgi:glutathione S-transferase
MSVPTPALASAIRFNRRISEIPMNIVLYYAPNACSLVPYVTLTEAGADFEVQALNMRKEQQKSADYLKLNPKHKVPLLVVDGRPLSENVAIQVWIARNFPQAKLLPGDPWQEVQAVSVLAWCASGIHPYLSRINSTFKVCDVPGADARVRSLAEGFLFEAYRIADDMLAGRDYFFDHFTAADAHFFWCFRRGAQLKVDVSKFPNCSAHSERMKTRASVQKVLAFEKSTLEKFAGG